MRSPSRLLARLSIILSLSCVIVLSSTSTLASSGARFRAGRALPTLNFPLQLPGLLDPAHSQMSGYAVMNLTEAGLVKLLPENSKPVPDLATWKVSKGGRVYTFTIRSNARFGTGHRVTAADAAFSLRRALAPATQAQNWFVLSLIRGAEAFHAGKTSSLAGVKALGERTLQITLTYPAGYFLTQIANPAADVLEKRVLQGRDAGPDGKTNFLQNHCLALRGAGPFILHCTKDGKSLSLSGNPHRFLLTPNPYYYGRRPRLQIEAFARTPAEDYAAYQRGTLNVLALQPEWVDQWRGKSREFRLWRTDTITYLLPNTHMAPLDNAHCRLAMAYGIDRNLLANSVLSRTSEPLYTLVPKGMLGWYVGSDVPHYDVKRARAELARCPGRNSPISWKYSKDCETCDIVRTLDAVAATLGRIGLNIQRTPVSGDEYLGVAFRGKPLDETDTQLIRTGWAEDYPDPQDYVTVLLRSNAPYNLGGWSNGGFDRLVDRADRITNRAERARLYIRAQRLALNRGALIPLTNRYNFALIKPAVHGLVTNPAFGLAPKHMDWANVTIDGR